MKKVEKAVPEVEKKKGGVSKKIEKKLSQKTEEIPEKIRRLVPANAVGILENHGLLHIEKDFFAELPILKFPGEIVVVDSEKDAKKAVSALLKEKILGFDTETRPSFVRGNSYLTSIVQLCGAEKAYVFRLEFCGGVPVLFPIFKTSKILKVGVAVKDDVRRLKDRAPFVDAGFVDAASFTKAAKIENTGLRALCSFFLGGRISKSEQVSNWAAAKLSKEQILYAATDAWASRELFLKLQNLGIAPKKIRQKSLFEAPEILSKKAILKKFGLKNKSEKSLFFLKKKTRFERSRKRYVPDK